MTMNRFFKRLTAYASPEMFNPWADVCRYDRRPDAPADRRRRLRAHLNVRAKIVLLGEAPGHLGCRASGVPFTSERILLETGVPRVGIERQRITTTPRSLSEPSATIVWGALRDGGIDADTILWNSVPWHPMKNGQPRTNRTPTDAERIAGLELLEMFLAMFPDAAVCAVGKIAERSLHELNVTPAATLRHPANGGATLFRAGLKRILQERELYRPRQTGLDL